MEKIRLSEMGKINIKIFYSGYSGYRKFEGKRRSFNPLPLQPQTDIQYFIPYAIIFQPVPSEYFRAVPTLLLTHVTHLWCV
jgi:hypothetical protein